MAESVGDVMGQEANPAPKEWPICHRYDPGQAVALCGKSVANEDECVDDAVHSDSHLNCGVCYARDEARRAE